MPLLYQARVARWLDACFGPQIAADKQERTHRFLEEGIELAQAMGCTRHEAHLLVDYTFDRPIGDVEQEAGGVMVTLAALCSARGIDMEECAVIELGRCWEKIERIREQQARKPKFSPLAESISHYF